MLRSIIEKWVEDNTWEWFNPYTQERELVGWHSVFYWIERAKRDFVPWRLAKLTEYFLEHLDKEWAYTLAACALDFQKSMNRKNEWTFSDLLYQMEQKLNIDATFQEKWHKRFTHILVDEAQDTNAQAMRIVKLLDPKALFIVGDADQTLYRFNGADPKGNLRDEFDNAFGGVRLKITQNFRSHPTILQRAEKLIICNYDEETEKYRKTLSACEGTEPGPDLTWAWHDTAEEEADEIVRELSNSLKNGKEPGDFFIMSRTNAQTAYFELELLQRKIPFVNLGQSSFFNRKVPGVIIAYMRLAIDPYAWKSYNRVYNVPSRFMSNSRGDYIQTRWLGHKFNDRLDRDNVVKEELTQHEHDLNERGWAGWQKGVSDLLHVLEVFDEYGKSDNAGAFVQEVVSLVLGRWMEEEYPTEMDGSASAYDDLAVIQEMASRFTIEQFMGYVDQLQSTNKVKPKDLVDYVLLGTIYRFKGLERKVVYVVGLSEGLLPHRFSLGANIPTDGVPLPRTGTVWDERNLTYVAVTRAIEECHLSGVADWPTVKELLVPSRFVAEMGLLGEKTHVS
jgi:superfamily I DNA/RNA helicase